MEKKKEKRKRKKERNKKNIKSYHSKSKAVQVHISEVSAKL